MIRGSIRLMDVSNKQTIAWIQLRGYSVVKYSPVVAFDFGNLNAAFAESATNKFLNFESDKPFGRNLPADIITHTYHCSLNKVTNVQSCTFSWKKRTRGFGREASISI